MITIINQSNAIEITEGNDKFSIIKSDIGRIDLKADKGYILISHSGTGRGPLDVKITYANVTSPSTANVTALYELLKGYSNSEAGSYHLFVATAGQTDFDCSTYFTLTANYRVYVNGSYQSWGHSPSDDTVVFASGLSLNDEVLVVV